MNLFRLLTGIFSLLALAGVQAQTACEKSPTGWTPCGPERTLSGAEIEENLFRKDMATRWEMTGGTSGRKFVLLLRNGGKLDFATASGGTNFGRDWKLEEGKICMRAYQNIWGGKFNCGPVVVADGKLYWIDSDDNSKSHLTSVTFVNP